MTFLHRRSWYQNHLFSILANNNINILSSSQNYIYLFYIKRRHIRRCERCARHIAGNKMNQNWQFVPYDTTTTIFQLREIFIYTIHHDILILYEWYQISMCSYMIVCLHKTITIITTVYCCCTKYTHTYTYNYTLYLSIIIIIVTNYNFHSIYYLSSLFLFNDTWKCIYNLKYFWMNVEFPNNHPDWVCRSNTDIYTIKLY